MQYTRKPTVGLAHILMNRGAYRVYVYDYVSDRGSSSSLAPGANHFHNRDDAYARVCELNDWQRLGTKGHEVYKGDATFNKAFKVEPWEHVYLTKDKVIFFVWDTREITRVARRPNVDVLPHLHVERSDNHKPLAKDGKWLQQSELERLPVTFKTDKQAANEDDMAISTADNTSLASDVSSVGSGDTQQGLGSIVCLLHDGSVIAKGTVQQLTEQFKLDNNMITKDTIRIGKVTIPAGTKLQFSNEGFAIYKGVQVAKSAVETMQNFESKDMPVIDVDDMVEILVNMPDAQHHINRLPALGVIVLGMQPTAGKAKLLVQMPDSMRVAHSLADFMTEIGYDANEIILTSPELARLVGLADDAKIREIVNSDFDFGFASRHDRPIRK